VKAEEGKQLIRINVILLTISFKTKPEPKFSLFLDDFQKMLSSLIFSPVMYYLHTFSVYT